MVNWTVKLAAVSVVALCQGAAAQSSSGSGLRGTFDRSFHARGPTGHLCLSPRTSTRTNPILSNTYQHLVVLKNACSKTITVRVCYKGSSDCKQVSVRPYQDETVFLGEMKGVPMFDVDYVERSPL